MHNQWYDISCAILYLLQTSTYIKDCETQATLATDGVNVPNSVPYCMLRYETVNPQ